jgi:hypothetical protein
VIGEQILGFKAENGKLIGACTGSELCELESGNAMGANLYRDPRKRVKGNQIVGETPTEEHWRAMAGVGEQALNSIRH